MPRRRSYERLSPPLLHESRRCSVGGNDAERIAFTQRGDAELGSANLYRIRQHGLKHRLKFAGGTRDDSQHLRGRRLLLQGFAQIIGALPQLVEQARVLDGDNGLLGKAREERDLLVGEPANLLAEYIDSANQRPFLEHRYKNNCANPQETDEVHGSYIALAIWRNRAKIIDLHHLLRSNHFSMAAPRTGTECLVPPRLGICRRNIVKRTMTKCVTVV